MNVLLDTSLGCVNQPINPQIMKARVILMCHTYVHVAYSYVILTCTWHTHVSYLRARVILMCHTYVHVSYSCVIRTSTLQETRPQQDLLQMMKAVGVPPEEVHFVCHKHLHRDHTSWNVVPTADKGVVPTFPNAKHLVQQAELQYWSSSEPFWERVAYWTNVQPLQDACHYLLLTTYY